MTIETDVAIIGAGPIGLFAVFELGLLGVVAAVAFAFLADDDDETHSHADTPRQKIFSLPSDMAVEEASAQVIDHMHSRVPVYDEQRGPEHIVGVVYSKDLSRLIYFRPAGTKSVRTAGDRRHPKGPSCQCPLRRG